MISRHQNTRLTYEQLDRLVDQAAFGLLQLGLEPGDRVGLWAQNCWEWVVAQYATARVGLVLVNINPAYRSTELEYALNKVGCKGLILAPAVKANSFVDTVYSLAPELKAQLPAESGTKASLARLPELEHVIVLGTEAFPGMLNFETICHSAISPSDVGVLDSVSESLCEHDPINIQFTSGTTGKPKGATLTHHNVLNNGYITGRILAYSEADTVCIPVPMYHCFGMVLGTTACTTSGAAIVFPSETYEPQAVLEAVQEEQCTSLYGVPTMFIAELELSNFTEFDLSSLRTGIMAGSPCPEEIMRRVMTEMHIDEMTVCYGMTETSPVSFQVGKLHLARRQEQPRSPGSSAIQSGERSRRRLLASPPEHTHSSSGPFSITTHHPHTASMPRHCHGNPRHCCRSAHSQNHPIAAESSR